MTLKKTIRRILNEETNPSGEKIKSLIEKVGLISVSKLLGGYSNVLKITDNYLNLTREGLIKTIQDFIEYNGSFTLSEIGLEEITIYEDGENLEQVYYFDKQGYEVNSYGTDENGYWDEEEQDSQYYSYDSKDADGDYKLPTYELRDIVQSIMTYYETYHQI